MTSYVFLTHCDLWQASQNWFLLFLLLSVDTPYHQGYVCGCKKTYLAYSTVSTRMAGTSLHCIRYKCIELAGAHNHMWDMSTASHICLTTIWIHHILLVSMATQWHHMMCVWLKRLNSIYINVVLIVQIYMSRIEKCSYSQWDGSAVKYVKGHLLHDFVECL